MRYPISPLPALAPLLAGPIRVDLMARAAWVDDRQLAITPRAFDLLVAFVQHPNRTLAREQLLALAWPEPEAVDDRAVDPMVFRLRRALGAHAGLILTSQGHGYRLFVADHL